MKLSDIQELKRQGSYEEALTEIDNYETSEESDNYTLDLIKADIYIWTGKLEHALDLVNGVIDSAILNHKHNEYLLAGSVKSAALRGLGLIYESAKIINEFSKFVKTDFNFDQLILSRFYHECGNVFMAKGDLLGATKNYNLTIPIREKLDDTKGLASVYNKLGRVYTMMGNYKKAINIFAKSLELDIALDNVQSIAITKGNMGLVYFKLKEEEKAFDFMDHSLIDLLKLGNDTLICGAIYDLFTCMREVNKESSLLYIGQMKEIYSKKENKDNMNIFLIYNLMQALLLKDSNRGKDRYQAQDILSNLVTLDVNFRLKVDVLINLIDLLLQELESYNNDAVMIEVSGYMNQIEELAKKNNSNRILIESFIMEARFQMILKNLDGSYKLFKQAMDLAIKYEINDLIEIIKEERMEFEKEIEEWNNIINQNLSNVKEMQMNKYKNYIMMVKEKIRIY